MKRFAPWFVLLLWPGLAVAECTVRQRTSVKVEVAGGLILVPMLVNGIPGTFVLDTGAALTVVTPDAVARFKLALDEWTATTMRGVGGVERRRNANPRSVEIGGVPLRRRSIAGDSTLRVTTLTKSEITGHRIDGLLGREFLSLFDISVDMPNRVLALHDVHGCSGSFLPWTEPYGSVAVENPAENALVVPVELDGVGLRALLDTGANHTLVAAPGMARMQLGLERLRNDPSHVVNGAGPHTVTMWRHRFAALQFGGETFAGPSFLVAPVQLYPISDMLLGSDWLAGRRIWISYATRQLFVTRPAGSSR